MNPLTFDENEPIKAEERGDWREHGDNLILLLKENLKQREKLLDYLEDQILSTDYVDMPWGGKGRHKQLGGLCARSLQLLDYTTAFNEAWDLKLAPDSILVAVLLRTLPYAGANKAQAKYIKKTQATIRARSFSWVKNPYFDHAESQAIFLETLLKADGIRPEEIMVALNSSRSLLLWALTVSEDYIDKFSGG